jgi:predicted deacylase
VQSSETIAPFVLHEEIVRAGTRRVIELPVARLAAGSWTTMPIVVLHGKTPGPTAWICGAIHGDELNGVEIVRQLIKRLSPRHLSGTLLAVPIVNVFGVTSGSRYLPDRRDLNRSFPGSKRGSLASRIARLFYDNVASRCTLGLDFHTGSGGRCNLPQLRCDLDDAETRRLANLFCPPVLLHADLRDGSLRAAAQDDGIRVLLYEAGEAHRFDHDVIAFGVEGAMRVLHGIGMLAAAPPVGHGAPLCSRSSSWVRAGRSGFAHIEARLGQYVTPAQRIGVISDSTGGSDMVVRARSAGLIIGVLKTAHVHRGDDLVHIAELEG